MCPRILIHNGKEYLVDKDNNAEEIKPEENKPTDEAPEEDKPTEEAPEEGEPTEEAPTDDEIDTAAKKAADAIVSQLPIDALNKTLKAFEQKEEKMSGKVKNILDKKIGEKDLAKMTSKEKIVKFFQACVQNDRETLKALSEGTAADGGYLFPDEFRHEVIRDIVEKFSMRSLVRVIPMKRDVMKIPTLTSGPKVTWTDENAIKSTTTATFNQATLTVFKMAAILYSSDELIEDSDQIDVVDFIVTLFSEAIQREEDRVITVGNGTTQPTGLTTARAATTIASIASATGNLSFDDMINLEYSLPMKYHPNAKYLVHRGNIRELRKLKDSNNRYYWMEPVAAGQPATFHGYPVIENNNLPESEIFFGDYKMGYWLGDRQKMSVKITQETETAFTKDQTGIRVVSRIAGTVVLGQAIKGLTGIA